MLILQIDRHFVYHCENDWYRTRTFANQGLHSLNDMPAYICRESKTWYRFGKKHRAGDSPAYISHDKDFGGYDLTFIHYWKDGEPHRENGPAEFVLNNQNQLFGRGLFYLNGTQYSELHYRWILFRKWLKRKWNEITFSK